MKAKLFDSTGKEKSDVELPAVFDTKIREDMAQKYNEIYVYDNRVWYSPYEEAGRRHSASGTISHRRHEWKGHYGKGISRVPRKAMWRRGTQFYWIGAEVSGTRGGRTVHAPSGERKPMKINKREVQMAMASAIASTASKELIVKRYASIDKIASAPFVIESLPTKTKDLVSAISKIFPSMLNVIFKTKSVRAGKGTSRNRRYKSTAGVLIVTGSQESAKFSGFDVIPVKQLSISDLFPLGRLTLYTKAAIAELGAKK